MCAVAMHISEPTIPITVGVIGDPVAHSRSPAMHNAAFQHLGIQARYGRWHTPANELPERILSLRQPGMLGANVTLPHKIAVLQLLDHHSPEVLAIGAANTIIRRIDGSLDATNTDAPAVSATLRYDAQFEISNASVVILGASGAARAAAYALIQEGAAQITIANRTSSHAQTLIAQMPYSSTRLQALSLHEPALKECLTHADLIINATSLGWQPEDTPLDAALIPSDCLVFDMVYRPTRLQREAAARGARTLDGAGMLVRQAALAFEYWTGQAAPFDVMWLAFHNV